MLKRVLSTFPFFAFVSLPMTALAGCSTPLPLSPPDVCVTRADFRQAGFVGNEALDAATWRGLGDPVLDGLIRRARSANIDVRTAQERVRQARAGRTVAASRRWPAVAVTGSVSGQRSGLPDAVKVSGVHTARWLASTEVAREYIVRQVRASAWNSCRHCWKRSRTPSA
jgi:outer membrane protein TolC